MAEGLGQVREQEELLNVGWGAGWHIPEVGLTGLELREGRLVPRQRSTTGKERYKRRPKEMRLCTGLPSGPGLTPPGALRALGQPP